MGASLLALAKSIYYYIHTKTFIILPAFYFKSFPNAKMINFEMTKRVYLGKTLIMIERIKAHRKLSKRPIFLFNFVC